VIEHHRLGHVKISSGDLHDVLELITARISKGEKSYCIPLNLTKYVVSNRDRKLKDAISVAGLVIPDGVSMVWLSKRAGLHGIHRVTGIDLADALLSRAAKQEWTLYMLGASAGNLELAIENLRKRFGKVPIVGWRNGYFGEEDTEEIVREINTLRPDILLLGLGMPQKEYFIRDYFERLNVRFCLPVGGAFDVWAGVKDRTPSLFQRIGLEWLYRALYDKTRGLVIARYGPFFLRDLVFYKK